MSQQLRSVDAVSCAKVMGVLYAIFGLVMGIVFFLLFTVVGIFGSSSEFATHAGPLGFVLGAGSIVFFPICYGILGAIAGLIGSALYNVVAKYTGGIEIELG
jgi:hypothetical protein